MKRVLIAGNVGNREVRMQTSYAHAVRAAGAVGAFSLAETAKDAEAFAAEFDALLLPGGGDLPGELFGQTRHVSCQHDDPARDLSDRLLLEAFKNENKRILGICRGCQAANVFLRGTLHQHLPDEFEPVLWHSGNITGRHAVRIEADSVLASLLGAGENRINSSHHQAIDRPGEGLRVVAFAPDGVIEAVEGENMLLVQWHPERMMDTMRPLFDWLVSAV